jgi:hypothetical protein
MDALKARISVLESQVKFLCTHLKAPTNNNIRIKHEDDGSEYAPPPEERRPTSPIEIDIDPIDPAELISWTDIVREFYPLGTLSNLKKAKRDMIIRRVEVNFSFNSLVFCSGQSYGIENWLNRRKIHRRSRTLLCRAEYSPENHISKCSTA